MHSLFLFAARVAKTETCAIIRYKFKNLGTSICPKSYKKIKWKKIILFSSPSNGCLIKNVFHKQLLHYWKYIQIIITVRLFMRHICLLPMLIILRKLPAIIRFGFLYWLVYLIWANNSFLIFARFGFGSLKKSGVSLR